MTKVLWTMRQDGRYITKIHPGFKNNIQVVGTNLQPNFVIFVRKDVQESQLSPSGSSQTTDYCFDKVSNITFVNVYRALSLSGSLEYLLSWKQDKYSVVGGDSNSISQH